MDIYVLVLEIYSPVNDFHDRIIVGCYDAIDVALNDAKTISSAYCINRNHPYDCDVKYASIYSRKLGKPDLDHLPICVYCLDEDAVEWYEKECS